MSRIRRISIAGRLTLIAIAACLLTSCALLVRLGGVASRGGVARLALPARGALPAFSAVEAAVAARTLTARLGAMPAGRAFLRLDGLTLWSGSARVARIAQGGRLFIGSATATEVAVGQVGVGGVWVPARGGNLVQIATIRGATLRNGVALQHAPGGRTLASIRQGVSFEIEAVRDGHFLIRVSPTQRGWISASLVGITIAAIALDREVRDSLGEGSTLACARFRSSTGSAGLTTDSQPQETLNWMLLVNYPARSHSAADSLVRHFKRAGVRTVSHEVDSTLAGLCGSEVYYHLSRDDAARFVQASAASRWALRISSHNLSVLTDTVVLWLP